MLRHLIFFGCLGITIEVMFTGIKRLARKHWHAEGVSYVWMFPVYSLGGLGLEWLRLRVSGLVAFTAVGTLGIYLVEALTGLLLLLLIGQVPWDYKEKGWLWGTICPTYAPFWALLCLCFGLFW